ncbi:hypothetical protein AVEN_232214-1 [Araneus ventricosus]|uniref:Uncharacterized protein n=1 Tax=Araneus ventricosus TaxID=182803 RepID=A0A4Y2SZQ1_ARAVE|nr:hypothetical protein AVEN_232214-1 [Araneus ventricosus]
MLMDSAAAETGHRRHLESFASGTPPTNSTLFLIRYRTFEVVEVCLLAQSVVAESINFFLLSRVRSTQRESIVIVKKFELQILTNLHVLDLPESEKHNLGIMSVCEQDNSKTIRATGMKFGM